MVVHGAWFFTPQRPREKNGNGLRKFSISQRPDNSHARTLKP
jgi:hypothetical protein